MLRLNQPVPHIDWPQDHLKIPAGNGQFMAIEANNAKRTKREFFVLSGSVFNWDAITTATILIPSPVDGDFWITGLSCACYLSTGNMVASLGRDFNITVSDILSEYSLFTPFITYDAIRYPIDTPMSQVSQLRSIESFAQPYPLLRKGGLRITCGPHYNGAPPSGAVSFHMAFYGWKEYEYAAV